MRRERLRSEPSTVRIASIPAAHPYVRAVTDDPRISVLADPLPEGAAAGVWWPPVILDPEWIRSNAAVADVLHVHFGTESFPPEHLQRTLDAARDAGWPVVFTVHEVEHPQLSDQRAYRDQLDILVPRADALITLTTTAADAIESTWGRRPIVLPHPRLLGDLPTPAPERPGAFRIGMHLKDIRPSVDAIGATRQLIGAVRSLPGTEAEIRMHRSVRDTGALDEVRRLVLGEPSVTLIEHDRLDDRELAAQLGTLDACVLPYRAGSHSGWLELCWDLGVTVVHPAIGFFAAQHPGSGTAVFTPDDSGQSLAAALDPVIGSAARAGTPERSALIGEREEHRARVDQTTVLAHLALYESLLDEARLRESGRRA